MKLKIDQIFLDKQDPYTKKRRLNIKNISISIIVLLFLFLVLGEFMEKKEEKVQEKPLNYLSHLPKKTSNLSGSYKEPEYDDIIPSEIKETKANRRKGFSKEKLIGSKQAVQVLGKVIATSKNPVPLRAKIVRLKNPSKDYQLDFKLKEGSLLLGKAQVDKISERLHITFYSLLINGKRYSIQATAFMPNGSYGIEGEFQSGEFKKYSSRFGANFIGGLSQGLKQKSVTSSGAILEVSGLGNAILNGISLSFLDYAKDKARGNENPENKITIPDKTHFFVYFQQ